MKNDQLIDFKQSAYGAVSALRYNIFESRPSSFSLTMAPIIEAFYKNTPVSQSNKKVLDLACGTGQLAGCFLNKGYQVTGIDLSKEMLHYAQINNEKYVYNGHARFVNSDASDFHLPSKFGLGISTFNGMNHLPGLDQVVQSIQNMYDALVPNGWFVFDINTQKGLKNLVSHTEVMDTDTEITIRKRMFNRDKVVLYASGCFLHEGTWLRYQETIEKIIIPTEFLRKEMLKMGWTTIQFMRRDLAITLDTPEEEEMVYILAQK